MVCREPGTGLLLMQVLPDRRATRTFDSPKAMIGFLSVESHRDVAPILDVVEKNVEISYVGRDTSRLRALDEAIQTLRG